MLAPMPDPSPRPPLTREAIVDAARQITIVGGIEGLNMRRVASSLGVTAPALYAHVRHKSDLLQAIAERELEGLVARFEEVDDADPVERVRRYARAYVDHALDEPELFHVMFLTQPGLTIEQGDDLPIASKAFAMPSAATVEAIETGAFKAADPLMASLTMWTAVHGVATVLLLGLELDDAGTDELVTSVVETVIAGLSA
jgi:AcrR family transcriptional regulator